MKTNLTVKLSTKYIFVYYSIDRTYFNTSTVFFVTVDTKKKWGSSFTVSEKKKFFLPLATGVKIASTSWDVAYYCNRWLYKMEHKNDVTWVMASQTFHKSLWKGKRKGISINLYYLLYLFIEKLFNLIRTRFSCWLKTCPMIVNTAVLYSFRFVFHGKFNQTILFYHL